MRSKIERCAKLTDNAQANRSQVADALQASEHAISDANRRVIELDRQQETVDSSLTARVASEYPDIKQQINRQQAALAQASSTVVPGGRADTTKLLLNGQNPNQIARNLTYYSYVSRERAVLIAALRESRAAPG